MKVYMALYNNTIQVHEPVRETTASYWFEDEEGLKGSYLKRGTMEYSFFDSYELAKEHLIERNEKAVARAQRLLLGKIEQLKQANNL